MSKLSSVTTLSSCFVIMLLLLDSVKAISLQEAYFVHQKVKADLNKPRILSADFGPTYSGKSPVLHFDSETGNIRVLRPRDEPFTLKQILERARQKMRQLSFQGSLTEFEPSSTDRFNHLRPNLSN